MEMELIKQVVRVGNGGGVILPKEWIKGKAIVRLIEKPLNLKREVLELLERCLGDIRGIYLVGSYAREEETQKSDVDVLVITNKTNEKIERGKYNILLISEEQVKKSLDENILPILPMLKEARVILNEQLISEYRKTELTKKNLKWHIETTKSALKVSKTALELAEMENKNVSDRIMYSLILRLREEYIVDCLMKNKRASKKEFLELVKKIAYSADSYEAYLRAKNNEKVKRVIPAKEAWKIYNYAVKKIGEQEWLIKRRK